MRYLIIIIAFISSLGSAAQDVSLSAKVSKEVVGQGEIFQYSVTLVNARADINVPRMDNFEIVQGPSVSSNYSIVNGRTTQEYSKTFRLRPKRTGKFKIPAAWASTPKGKVKSNEIIIEVVKGQAPAPKPTSTAELIATVEIDKKKVFVGEPVVVSYKVYTRYREFGAEEINYPGTDGFWAEDVETSGDWKTEVLNGKTYYYVEAKRQILFPQTTGKLDIGEFSLTAVCRERWYSNTKRLSAASRPQSIQVVPIPAGKNEHFVGTYSPLSIDAKVNTNEVRANEAINFTVTIEGKGNMRLLNEPEFDFPPDLEIFDPKVKDNIKVHSYGESGSRIYEYVMIPRSQGEYEIPGIELQFFDPDNEKFVSVNSGDVRFNVLKGDGSGASTYTYDSQTEVNILNQDIRFIKRDSANLRVINRPFYGSIAFYSLMSFPGLAFVFVLLFKRRKEQQESDVEGTRMRKAARVARKHLKAASDLASSSDSKLFYETLYKAILGYLGDKFGIAQSELNKERIATELGATGSGRDEHPLISLIEECEMARFAPVSGTTNAQMLDRASDLISQIERGK